MHSKLQNSKKFCCLPLGMIHW